MNYLSKTVWLRNEHSPLYKNEYNDTLITIADKSYLYTLQYSPWYSYKINKFYNLFISFLFLFSFFVSFSALFSRSIEILGNTAGPVIESTKSISLCLKLQFFKINYKNIIKILFKTLKQVQSRVDTKTLFQI